VRVHLADFMADHSFARRLNILGTLGVFTLCGHICKEGTSQPNRVISNPIHRMPRAEYTETIRSEQVVAIAFSDFIRDNCPGRAERKRRTSRNERYEENYGEKACNAPGHIELHP
jgi:hypothetical protein